MRRGFSSNLLLSQRLGTVRSRQGISQSFGTGSAEANSSAEGKATSTDDFLKSFGILLEEPKQEKLVGRWDWHLWQLCAALLPALGVFGLVQIARADMRKEEAILLQQKQAKSKEDQAERLTNPAEPQNPDEDHPEDPNKQLQAKVLALEQALQRLQMQQLMQQAVTPGVKMDIRPALHANPLQHNVDTSSNQHGTATNISQQGTSVVLNPGDDKHQCAQPGQAAAAEHSNNPNTVSVIRWHLQHYRQQAMSNLKAVFAMSGEKSDEKDKQTPDT